MTADPPNQKARTLAMWCHLSALIWIPGSMVSLPFLGLLLPLIIWLNNRNQYPFVDQQGRESVNFQLSMMCYSLIAGLLFIFLAFMACAGLGSADFANNLTILAFATLAFVLLMLVFQLSVIIFAAIKAYNGQSYRYPFTIRFLR